MHLKILNICDEYGKQNTATVLLLMGLIKMSDLRHLNNAEIKYSTFILDDNKTFINLESSRNFQAQLKSSYPEIPPMVENITLVDSSFDIF